jgi:alkyldihydroxyacetonephosphate synthase
VRRGRVSVTGWRDARPLLGRLRDVCEDVRDDEEAVVAASADWWPLALHWTRAGDVAAPASVVCRPRDDEEVAALLRLCHAESMPVTTTGGRSGVCGASVPLFGGVVVDMTAIAGVVDLDATSLLADVRAGTFGHHLATRLHDQEMTTGHWPQSVELSTVGGWLACRSAGQYSTRYGKIEDIVVGLDVILADGEWVRTGGAPRQAVGPDLTQLFVGSEGTLGIITKARLRVRPLPAHDWRAAYGFPTFTTGMEACRRILRRGGTPAVLRLYDGVESARSHGTDGATCVLLVLDEADDDVLSATAAIVTSECDGGDALDVALVEQWLAHRNDVTALHDLTAKGFVVDTLEVSAAWAQLPAVYEATVDALRRQRHCLVASAHLSHSYSDGACLYFTFAALPPSDEIEATYVSLWDAGTRAALAHGASLSHHHGVGLNRARFIADALGAAAGTLAKLKGALDPKGILNPGKLGLVSSFGEVEWPR